MIRVLERKSGTRYEVFVQGATGRKVYIGVYDSLNDAKEAEKAGKARTKNAGKHVVAFKLYAVHDNQAETLVAHDTFPQTDWRTYEIDVNGKTVGVWVALLDERAEPHPYDVWKFNPETDIDNGGSPF